MLLIQSEERQRGAKYLSYIVIPSIPLLERDTKGESKRGEASLAYPFPLPYQGRGIKGVGCQINIKGDGVTKTS